MRQVASLLQDPKRSWLRLLVPEVGNFYTDLKLVDALTEYDHFFALSRRRYVPPNFAEIRHVLNIAQVNPACIAVRTKDLLDASTRMLALTACSVAAAGRIESQYIHGG